jgi:CheY-like chemotaxis protein
MIKANILIVEDELLIAKSIAKKLNKLGYNIANIVASGTEAIEYANKASLDLILMDIAIKGKIDGIEAANIIQQTANVPIIFLTAYVNDETIERASKTGCYGYLIKPFRDRELQAMIQVTLSKHQQPIPQRALHIKKSESVVQDDCVYHDKITTLPNKLFLQDLFNYLSSFTNQTDIKQNNKAIQFKLPTSNDSLKSLAVFNIQLKRLKRAPVGMKSQSFNSLLKEIARRLSNFVNNLPEHGATVYLQQDNFVVLLSLDTRLEATQYAQYMFDKLSESFMIDEREIYLMPQIGIAFCPSDSTNVEQLLQQSKKAIEHGKQAKKDTKIYTYVSKEEPSLSPDRQCSM